MTTMFQGSYGPGDIAVIRDVLKDWCTCTRPE
jgi:hypothetical protein